MNDKIKEAIELLGKAKKEVFEVVASEMVGLIIQPIEDALSLLKQSCETTSLGNSIRSIAKSIRSETDRNIINQAADRLDAWWAYIQELKGKGIQPDCVKIFNCKHFQGYSQSVPTPFGLGNCSEPLGDCAIKSESEDCTVDCPDYQQPDCSPSAEFVGKWQKRLENAVVLYKMGRPTEDWFQSTITGFREACVFLIAKDKTITKLQSKKYISLVQAREKALWECEKHKDTMSRQNDKETITAQAEALNPISDWYGGGTEGVRSDLEILTDAIADLQTDRKKVLAQAEQIKRLKEKLEKYIYTNEHINTAYKNGFEDGTKTTKNV